MIDDAENVSETIESTNACFLCGIPVTSCPPNPQDKIYSTWWMDCAESLIQILNLCSSFNSYLENGTYCTACRHNLYDMDYLFRSIKAMQRKLKRLESNVVLAFKSNYETLHAQKVVDPFQETILQRICEGLPEPTFQTTSNVRDAGFSLEDEIEERPHTRSYFRNFESSNGENKEESSEFSNGSEVAEGHPPDANESDDDWSPPDDLFTLKQRIKEKKKRVENTGRKPGSTNLYPAHLHRKRKDDERPKRTEKREKLLAKESTDDEIYCEVEGCKFVHVSREAVEVHRRKIHEKDPTPYYCLLCSERFKTKISVNEHIKQSHKCGKCEECGLLEMDAVEGLQPHLLKHRQREMENRKFSCVLPNCDKVFYNSSDLRTHVLSDHTERVHCEFCTKTLSSKKKLRQHLENVHYRRSPSWKCPNCRYHAESEEDLKAHCAKHEYLCAECGQKFQYKASYGIHLRTHQPQETWPHKCTFSGCGRRFVRSVNLRQHEEAHSKVLCYMCEMCPKAYNTSKALGQHVRLLHKKTRTSQHVRARE